MTKIPILLVLALAYAGCGEEGGSAEEWTWDLPENILPPRVPEDNPMTVAKVELGRFLFYDKRLSANQTQSCSSCHHQDLAFTDGLSRAEGSTGEIHPRSSMMLANVGYAASLTWANDVLDQLEQQALVPMFNETPVELGMAGMEDELLQRLRNDPRYPQMFAEAFPDASDPIAVGNVTKALGAFQRQLTSFNSKYDRWTRGDKTALSESEQRGLALFLGERLECFHCHGGFLFSQAADHEQNTFDQKAFMNNGLYNLDQEGSYPRGNQGLYDLTFDPEDKGLFKPPSLRNIAVTAPYMHDGSIATLEEVLEHYARGGRSVPDGTMIDGQDVSGDGRDNPNKSAFLRGFELTDQEREDVLAFLRALTDEEFLANPAYSDPFAEQ
jgi:cytochrome c peroxidase